MKGKILHRTFQYNYIAIQSRFYILIRECKGKGMTTDKVIFFYRSIFSIICGKVSLYFVKSIYTIVTLKLYICANLALTYIASFDYELVLAF